jgi:hypothetical protein
MSETTTPERLSADLEAALVRELAATWHDYNASHFRGKLRAPVIGLADGAGRLGLWHRETRTIELQRALVMAQPWGVVVEVLKHEMAHQYVHEVLGVLDETAHGPAFRELCERLGIDGAAAGLPAAASGPGAEKKILGRVAKLLALAESPNVHEAQAAMAEAQRLMLKHNLEAPARAGYGFRHLGEPTGRIGPAQRVLGGILMQHFFVEAIFVPVWRAAEGKRGRVLEICGTPENLDIAAYVHDFLTHTAERLWREYRRAKRLRGDGERRTFVTGVMAGFREKLEAQRAVHEAEGLVWVGDSDLRRYYRRRHPHVQQVRRAGVARSEAHMHGREAGRNIVIHRGVTTRGAGGGGLLGA